MDTLKKRKGELADRARNFEKGQQRSAGRSQVPQSHFTAIEPLETKIRGAGTCREELVRLSGCHDYSLGDFEAPERYRLGLDYNCFINCCAAMSSGSQTGEKGGA